MKKTRLLLLSAAIGIPLSGCGTVCNLASGDLDNYGGVQRDVTILTKPYPPDHTGSPEGFFLVLFDTALSFVGDTMTLPLTTYIHGSHECSADREGDRQETPRGALAGAVSIEKPRPIAITRDETD